MDVLVFIIYAFLLFWLIRKGVLNFVFSDPFISAKGFSVIFLLKILAVPFLYILYKYMYGGIENFDSGVFFRDASELNALAWTHPMEFMKALVGLQDDGEASLFHKLYYPHSHNWDNGRLRILFYNDNRIVIRLHAVLHFICFGSYFAHALFSCFLSYIGLVLIYKSLRNYFPGKELALLLVLCLYPSLWLHTGALLKEGPALFVMGSLIWCAREIGAGKRFVIFFLLCLFPFAVLLKPYLLLFAFLCFQVLFSLDKPGLRYPFLFFCLVLVLAGCGFESISRWRTGKSLIQVAKARQVVFKDASTGGIFLSDSSCLLRLPYKDSVYLHPTARPGYYRLGEKASFMYWEHSHQQDTLYCTSNTDTSRVYLEEYRMPESRSNLSVGEKGQNPLKILGLSFYNALLVPLFHNAKSALHLVASFENIMLLICLLYSLWGLLMSDKKVFPVLVFLVFALGECFLVAYTSPNSGAIFRYRAPAVVFIVISALYFFPLRGKRSGKLSNTN
ncbi:MAG TPA: hypothetical protein PLQ93_11030 [Bacteroidia bacterium]|nr:hypothetical protein [Bacteroidia bacterium]